MSHLAPTQNRASLIRSISILAYFFIFLQGSMILLPFGWLLLTGLFNAEPLLRVLIGLADLALLVLAINSFYQRTRWTMPVEIIAFFILLLPLLKIITSYSFEWFHYFLFLFPVGCFICLFPLSIFVAHSKYVKDARRTANTD